MSYFSFNTKYLKDHGLKIAIVYLHVKGCFEVWLSARNREISKKYEFMFKRDIADDLVIFHDENNPDAIIECTLMFVPDFEDPELLMNIIGQGAEKFLTAVSNILIR